MCISFQIKTFYDFSPCAYDTQACVCTVSQANAAYTHAAQQVWRSEHTLRCSALPSAWCRRRILGVLPVAHQLLGMSLSPPPSSCSVSAGILGCALKCPGLQVFCDLNPGLHASMASALPEDSSSQPSD